jgi:hypothetical protein
VKRIVMFVLLFAAVAHAQPVDKPWAAGVAQAEQDRALAMYREGNGEFEESRYAQALTKYREAIKHWDHPAIRFNMAVSLINLDQPLEAYDNLTAALKFGAAPIGAEAFAQAQTYKKLLDGQLTHLKITCDMDGAEVTLDGQPILHGTGEADRLLMPGAHQVVASKAGFVTETSALVLVPGKETVHAVKLAKLEVKTHLERRWKARTPWIVVGTGVAGLAIGGTLEALSHGEYQTYNQLLAAQCPVGCGPSLPPGMQKVDASTTSHKNLGHIENVAGVTLLGVGGAVAIAGLVGVYLNQPHSVLEHAPVVVPTGNGISASWMW